MTVARVLTCSHPSLFSGICQSSLVSSIGRLCASVQQSRQSVASTLDVNKGGRATLSNYLGQGRKSVGDTAQAILLDFGEITPFPSPPRAPVKSMIPFVKHEGYERMPNLTCSPDFGPFPPPVDTGAAGFFSRASDPSAGFRHSAGILLRWT